MKRIMIVILALAAVAAVGIAVFIVTFDINMYRPALVSQIQSAVGGRVEVGRLSLALKGRIVLGVEGFRMYPAGNAAEASVLSFDRAEAGLELMPLLQRRVEISSISIDKPQMYLVRSKDGKIGFSGYGKAPSPAAENVTAAPVALGMKIDLIAIRGATVRFTDMMGEEPAEIVIKSLDADLKNVSVTGPVTFSVKAAVASERQNLSVSGIVGGFMTGDTFLKDFSAEVDLAAFRYGEMLKALPMLGKTGLKEGLAGVLKADIRDLQLEGGKVSKLSADLKIAGGRLILNQIRAPIEDISLDASAEGRTITVRSFAARVVNGTLNGTVTIDDYLSAPRTSIALTAQAQGFHEFLATVAAVKQNLDGNAKITFSGRMTGSSWPEISRTLTGTGTFALDSGIIINTNMLDQTMGALTVFPNLVNSMQGKASAPPQEAFREKYTVLKPLNQTFSIEGGYINVPDLILQSEYLDMQGDARMSLTGDISGSGIVRFAAPVSGAMVMAVPQIKAITDQQGLVTFPIAFKGGSEGFKVIPDTKYIGRKIAVEAAGDAVSGYLKKVSEAQAETQPAGGAPAAGATQKPPKLKDFLKAIADEAAKND